MIDATSLLLQAHAARRNGALSEAAALCEQAIAARPDLHDALRLRLRLAEDDGDGERIVAALAALVRHDAEDVESCAALGIRLCDSGQFDRAASVLRPVASSLDDRGGALSCFATALAHGGQWQELRSLQPLLDREAASGALPSYPPFGLVAMARLAAGVDRDRLLAEAAALEASPRWIDANQALSRVSEAIAAARPFAMLRLDASMAAFAALCSRTALRLLRPENRLALLDTVWPTWFGTGAAGAEAVLPELRGGFTTAIEGADLVAMPGVAELENDLPRFGALAELHWLARSGTDAAFAETDVARGMHREVPYLRTALAGLPFLGFVGAQPAMFRKLAHFCGVSDTRFVPVPRDASTPVAEDGLDPRGFLFDGYASTFEGLTVPFPGAVFLVSAPGPLGTVFAGRIKALGGIALDIGPLAASWAGG